MVECGSKFCLTGDDDGDSDGATSMNRLFNREREGEKEIVWVKNENHLYFWKI